jgi:subfamily B ATP-binding cassette protein HlyB/CyaB
MDDIARTLQDVELFAFLEPKQLEEMASKFELARYNLGELVFEEGAEGDRFYIVHSGKVRIVKRQDSGKETTLKTMKAGEYFGEIALLEDTPRTAGVRAATETTLLYIWRDDFEAVLRRFPALRKQLTQIIRSRTLQNFIRLFSGLGRTIKAGRFQRLLAQVDLVEADDRQIIDPATALQRKKKRAIADLPRTALGDLGGDGPEADPHAAPQPAPEPEKSSGLSDLESSDGMQTLVGGLGGAADGMQTIVGGIGGEAGSDSAKTSFFSGGPDMLRGEARKPSPAALFILNEGDMRILPPAAEGEDADRIVDDLGILKPGESFGEELIVGEESSGLRYRPRGTCRLFRIPVDALKNLIEGDSNLEQYFRDRADRWLDLAGKQTHAEAEALRTAESAPAAPAEPVDAIVAEAERIDDRREAESQITIGPPASPISKFPDIRQNEQSDCGAACLSMILRYNGKRVGVGRLRDMANVNVDGASMSSLAETAEDLGFLTAGKIITFDTLDDQPLPLIAHWRGIHYIVVYRVEANKVWVADPDLGHVTYTRDEFMQHWSGHVLLFQPTPAVQEVEETRNSWGRFIAHFKAEKGLIWYLLAAAAVMQIIALSSPIFTQQVVDAVINAENSSLLVVLLGAMAALKIAQAISGSVRSYMIAHLTMRVSHRMLSRFYNHLLALPARFFGVRRPGDIMSRFADNDQIREVLMGKPLEILVDLALIAVAFLLMFYYSAQLSLLVVFFVIPFVVLAAIATPVVRRAKARALAAAGAERAQVIEAVSGLETVKAFGLERQFRGRWEASFAHSQNYNYRAKLVILGFDTLSGGLNAFATLFMLWWGASLVIAGHMTIGELMAFNVLVGMIFAPILGFVGLWNQIQQAGAAVERLNEVYDAKSEAEQAQARIRPGKLDGHIRFDSVFFRYGPEETPLILKNISFEVRPGETLAIVGRSGAGKTTLARLILGMYPPAEGRILIDDIDIREMDRRSLRRNIGVVLQDSFLFRGSVSANIAGTTAAGDRLRIMRAAQLATADEFIEDLPDGYETDIGERGSSLSGGQRQRLCLARAFYREPSILIMDEPTSALDSETEEAIQRNLDEFMATRTGIVIAHRMSTVRNADQILVLDRGEIVERGAHDDLMEQRGLYHQLCSGQLDL